MNWDPGTFRPHLTHRQLKKRLRGVLIQPDFPAALPELSAEVAPRRLINPLISFLYEVDPRLKWRAVTAIGQVTADLAAVDLESARVIMRRLMWNLNDESGGIGWGSPESLGEIMARQGRLADEYQSILCSYLAPGKNHLEHEGLQPGLLWAIGRLGRADPARTEAAATDLGLYLDSSRPEIRGHAVWAGLPLADDEQLQARLLKLQADTARFTLYDQGKLQTVVIGHLVKVPEKGHLE